MSDGNLAVWKHVSVHRDLYGYMDGLRIIGVSVDSPHLRDAQERKSDGLGPMP